MPSKKTKGVNAQLVKEEVKKEVKKEMKTVGQGPGVVSSKRGPCMGRACARYCLSLCDPRNNLAKIPAPPAYPSAVYQVRIRGTTGTGTTGFAGIVVSPWATLFRDANCFKLSTDATNTVAFGDNVGVVAANKFAAYPSNSQYTSANFTESTAATAAITGRARLVSCAIYAEFAGAPLYASGQWVCGWHPNARTLSSTTIAVAYNQNWTIQQPLRTRGPGACSRYLPTDMDDTDYETYDDLINRPQDNLFIFLTNGPIAAPSAVRYEIVANWEIWQPSSMVSGATEYDAPTGAKVGSPDMMGMQDVLASAAQHAVDAARNSGISLNSIAQDVASYVADRIPVPIAAMGMGATAAAAGANMAIRGRHRDGLGMLEGGRVEL